MKTILAVLLAGAMIALAGCGGQAEKPAFKLTDVTGASFGKSLELTDHNGQRRTASLLSSDRTICSRYNCCS